MCVYTVVVTAGPIVYMVVYSAIYSMTTQLFTIAHTHVEAVFELAQRYGYAMYKRRLNSYVYIWCIELPIVSTKQSTHIQLLYSEQLSLIVN